MKTISNLLLIAGTGRNTGKTTLACKIINAFSNNYRITGLKISPHFHGGTKSLKLVINSENYNIYEETSSATGKDSSLMLKAGASQVFYIETVDEHLKRAFEKFLEIIPDSSPVVCESPALRNYVIPRVFFVVDNKAVEKRKTGITRWRLSADRWIDTSKENINDILKDKLSFGNNRWKYL